MNIIESLSDPNLLGGLPAFRNLETWTPWLVVLKAIYGLPLKADEAALFRKLTGRSRYSPPKGGWQEIVVITGRQSGKTRIAAAVATHEAMMASQQEDRTELYALVVSQDARSSQRTLLSYASVPFETLSVLKDSVVRKTSDTLTLDSGVVLAAYPCRPAAVRGLRAKVVVLDELAFYLSSEGNPTDTEMLRAVRPCLATTGGKLLVLSSPYAQQGALWDLQQQHFGRDESPVLVFNASAPEMNPVLPADYLDRLKETDPEGYRTEVLGEFRAGLSALLDPHAIDACIDRERRENPYEPQISYRAFTDPAGGNGGDAFTLAIGHRAADVIVVDVLRAWASPFNPSGVVDEIVALLGKYNLRFVTGDRYAGEWPAEQFRMRRVQYIPADRNKSDLYLDMVAPINSGLLRLPDSPELLREMRGLERRTGRVGKDHVDHRRGGHDDRANVVAGLLSVLPKGTERLNKLAPEPITDTRELRRLQIKACIDRAMAGRGSHPNAMDPWFRG